MTPSCTISPSELEYRRERAILPCWKSFAEMKRISAVRPVGGMSPAGPRSGPACVPRPVNSMTAHCSLAVIEVVSVFPSGKADAPMKPRRARHDPSF